MRSLCAINIFLLTFMVISSSAKFKVFKEWDYLNFTWPNSDLYKDAIEQKSYIPENNIIAGLKYFEGWYYITLPRMKRGVPATLTRFPANQPQDTSPLLTPYPSWDMNNVEDCNSLQNVQNVEIDTKGQIWIIDGGRTETLSSRPVVKCKPKLVVYDIKKNEIVLTYTFPEHVATFNGSFLYDIVVDQTDEGYAYITDNSGKDPGIIVFSVKDHHAWKIRHSETMRADPKATFFKVNDVTINTGINVAGIALGPKIHKSNDKIVVNDDREVFYAPLSSLHLYSINSSVLRNEEVGSKDSEYQGFVKDYGLKSSQSVAMLMDNQGVLYYNLLDKSSIARWDSHTPFLTGQKVIAKDAKYLEWPASFCIDEMGNLTVLVNRLNKFIYQTLDTTKANFRLISSNVGGKSYLFEEDYNNYDISTEKVATSSSTTERGSVHQHKDTEHTEHSTEPEPNTEHETKGEPEPSPEPEPTAEPTPEPEPTNHPLHDLNIGDSSSTPEPVKNEEENKIERVVSDQSEKPKSGARNLRVSLVGVVMAGAVFLL